MELPALSSKLEGNSRPIYFHMPVTHRGQAEGFVCPGIFVITHPDQAGFEYLNHCRQNLFSRQPILLQVVLDPLPNLRQGSRKLQHPVVFGLIADLSPMGMVTVLLSPARIASRGLKMAVIFGTDPNLSPSGRYCQAFDPT
jgi:hypothetical protein